MSSENAAELAGSIEVPQFSRTQIRTLVHPGDPESGSESGSESAPVADGLDAAEGPGDPFETD
jgi:hypothetical protein